MRRLSSWALAGLVLAAVPAAASPLPAESQAPQQAADKNKPANPSRPQERRPWKYWQGESQKEIGITDQQSARIEKIFQDAMPKLEATKKKLDQLEAGLSQLMKASVVDQAAFNQQLDQVNSARAELYKTRMLQLYGMRAVLTAEQRAKLQAILDRWEAAHRKSPDRR